jgi:hypothetical protein
MLEDGNEHELYVCEGHYELLAPLPTLRRFR